mgnify:CR=1 FL=1
MDSVTQSYSVLLVSASAKFMDSVLPLLPERSFSPITKAPDVSSARRCLLERSYDLLIINAPLPDEFGTNFALDICQSTQTGVLLLVRAEQYPDVSARVGASGVMTLQKPTNPAIFSSTLRLLCATRERLRRMEQKTATLEEKMAEIRLINRAKWVLIEQLKMTENEAHKFIERQAMDRCVTRRTIAENILATYK